MDMTQESDGYKRIRILTLRIYPDTDSKIRIHDQVWLKEFLKNKKKSFKIFQKSIRICKNWKNPFLKNIG